MPLQAGTRIGTYEVIGVLGVGGMGEVYRARDGELKRDVALKVLPPTFASDGDRLARFQREAETLASLNHPNIAHLYGLAGTSGMRALVMELVEGPTLAELIARGPLPLERSLGVAQQLAEALVSAHEQGIVHRDLKPANLKVTPGGVLKVLDFGLAKHAAGASNDDLGRERSTVTSPAMTRDGVILGTAAYMSPEQARGRPVDKRTDIWAFGAVLFETLTGQRPFDGDTVTDVLAAIVTREPDWNALPAGTPASVRRLLARCLVKDPRRRLHDMADARIELEDAASMPIEGAAAADATAVKARTSFKALALGAALVAAVALGIAGWALTRPRAGGVLTEYDVGLPDEAPIVFGKGSPWGEAWRAFDVSPAADFVVYIADRGDRTEIWYRSLTDATARAISGTANAYLLALSPDGSTVAFISGPALKLAAVDGSGVREIGQVLRPSGITWSSTDRIIVPDVDGGLFEFDRQGGTPRRVPGGGGGCYNPQPLGPGRLLCSRTLEPGLIASETGVRTPLQFDPGAGQAVIDFLASALVMVGPNHIAFSGGDGALFAARWRQDRVAAPRIDVPVRVRTEGMTGARQSAIAASGTLVYVPGGYGGRAQLVRRRGAEVPVPLPVPPLVVEQFDVHPRGTHIVVSSRVVNGADLSIFDMTTGRRTAWLGEYFQFEEPRWRPDGGAVIVHARPLRDATAGRILVGDPFSGQPPTPLAADPFRPSHWFTADQVLGSTLDTPPALVRFDVRSKVREVAEVRSTRAEQRPQVSPSKTLVALMSADQIVVRDFPGGRRQTTIGRGIDPLWLDDRTLVMRDGTTWYRARVRADGTMEGGPERWFQDPMFVDTYLRSHALTPSGELVYARSTLSLTATYLRVVPGWAEGIARAVERADTRAR